MATKVLVNGKFETRPGVYSTIKSGIKNPSQPQSYSNILIIDDGIGAGFGGGSGINGILQNGANAVYEFDSIQDFKGFVKGGELYNLANPLFKPSKKYAGVSKVFLVQARTTAPADIVVTLANGSFTVRPRDEGVNANGVLTGSVLSSGYAGKLVRTNIPTSTSTFLSSITQAAGLAVPQISTSVLANVNVGDQFGVTAAGVTKLYTASSTLPASVYTALAALLNADATVSAAMTITVTPSGLVSTGTTNNTVFTLTSIVVPAPAKFIFQIWHGSYRGFDAVNNIPWDNITAANSEAQLVIQSPVVSTVQELLTWFQTSNEFAQGFMLLDGSVATGNIVVGDLTTYPGYILATGGTESYSAADFDAALTKINNLDFTHILAMQYGSNATALNNTKLFTFITDESRFDRILVVGAGYDRDTFQYGAGSSAVTSAYYDSDKVVVVHGGCKKVFRNSAGFITFNQLYKAAAILGRCAGLEPQVPVTLKSISIDAEVHLLDDNEQEFAIAKGIMYSYYDYEFKAFVAGLDINSLQKNEFLINDDGTTYNWALKRIEAAINKAIVVDGKLRFFGDNAGGNRNTSSPEEVVVWAKGRLDDMCASDKKDNLLIKYQNVEASIDQDNLHLNYEFVGNTEISKIIATGTIIYG